MCKHEELLYGQCVCGEILTVEHLKHCKYVSPEETDAFGDNTIELLIKIYKMYLKELLDNILFGPSLAQHLNVCNLSRKRLEEIYKDVFGEKKENG